MFCAKVLADSITHQGCRLTTMEWTFPRCILAEVNTHRMLSRNAASSRAIPTERLIQRVIDNPFVPEFRLNQKGMQAGNALEDDDARVARAAWLNARDEAVERARDMHRWSIHKQYVNRLLEPWMWVTIIVSATDWENVWKLRCHPDAEPSFRRIAEMARESREKSNPVKAGDGYWHLPLFGHSGGFGQDDLDALPALSEKYHGHGIVSGHEAKMISAGRCARVSYLTHDGKRDPEQDIELALRLADSGHWSPFEHVATPAKTYDGTTPYVGNFRGWTQIRKYSPNECAPEVLP